MAILKGVAHHNRVVLLPPLFLGRFVGKCEGQLMQAKGVVKHCQPHHASLQAAPAQPGDKLINGVGFAAWAAGAAWRSGKEGGGVSGELLAPCQAV